MPDATPPLPSPADPSRPDPAGDGPGAPVPASSPVSLMITRRQKADLRAMGFSEGEIREMTPTEAHAHLGL